MMNFSSRAAIAAFASLLLLGAASAQTPAPAPGPAPATKSAPAKMAPAETKADKPRTAASLDCSKQADAKGLHGTERRKFRSECKKTSKVN
ncbi:MAG: phosphate starvation-inducible protein PsiF [Tardiphaga sp.]|nr:phosphate starvation-inducible protein PsiF [Tardiphaga sp.]